MANPLTKNEQLFISHWGDMGGEWGINRTVAQIHALLYIRHDALTAEEICDLLTIARSNASNSIKELERLGLVMRIHYPNDRREHFKTYDDVWELLRLIMQSRIEREITPTKAMLENLLQERDFSEESPTFQKQMGDALEVINSISTIGEQLLSLPSDTTKRVLKAGANLSKFITGDRPA